VPHLRSLLAALAVLALLAGPAQGWEKYREGRAGIPLETVVTMLHSAEGHALARDLVTKARASRRAGTATRFETQLLGALGELRSLDRHRGQLARPDHPRGWQRWNRTALRQRGPAAILNTLAAVLGEARQPQLPVAVPGQERVISHVDRAELERGLGADAVSFVDTLLARTRAASPAGRPDALGVNWWTAMNGLGDQAARALSDRGTLTPHMPGLTWAIRSYGKLQDGGAKLKGALVRWPLRGNTLALLGETGMPLENTVLWTDKDHFTDPRVPVAASKLGSGVQLRGNAITRDRAFVERWVRENLAKLTPEELRETRPLFLVSDDGGMLLKQVAEVLRQPELRPHAHLFAGVEQTGRGSNALVPTELPFRVVSMARSETKTFSGSMMWGYAIVTQAVRNLRRLEASGVRVGRRAVVIGAGPIGQGVASWLRFAGFQQIELWDKDEAKRRQLHLRDDKLQVLAGADLVITCAAGNRVLGPEVLREYARRGFAPKTQVWVNGGSPGEHGSLAARDLRPQGLQTDRRGFLTALWNGRRISIGQRTAGPDRDRLAQHKGWSVFDLRDGQVINGQSDLGGVKHSLFDRTGAMFYGELPLDPRRNDPVPGYAVQLELSMMHLAHLHALGRSNETGAQPVGGNANLVALPAGDRSRQESAVHALFAYGTHIMIAQPTDTRGRVIAW